MSPHVCLQVYSESVIPRIAKAASGVTGTPYNELMNSWGVYFLGFVGKYGYDRILKVRRDLKTLSSGWCDKWENDQIHSETTACVLSAVVLIMKHLVFIVSYISCCFNNKINKIAQLRVKRWLWVLFFVSNMKSWDNWGLKILLLYK